MANNRELSQLASLIVVDDTTRNIGIATTGFSNVGIGTTFPEGKFRVYDDNQNSNTYSSQVYRTSTNFSSGVGYRAYYESYYTTAGVQTSYASGINAQVSASVAAGSTNNGYIRAGLDVAWRNNLNAQASTDNGTLNILYGRGIQYGHFNDNAVSPITNTATGLYLTPYCLTGSIGTLIGIDINSVATSVGATATNVRGINCGIDTTDGTNSYNLYISGNANNYFAGSVGIGTTNPTSKLSVVGDVLVSGVSTFIGDGTSSGAAIFAQRNFNNTQGIKLYGTSSGNFVYSESTNSNAKPLVIDSSQSENIIFRIAGDTKTLIQPTGEVLIGSATSTGTTSQLLQVTGGAYVSGSVGIGITNPQRKLHLRAQNADGIFLDSSDQTGNQGSPGLRVRGQRFDGNASQSFSGQLVLEKWRMSAAINSGQNLGAIIFGGNYDTLPGITTGMTYGASIGAMSEGTFSDIATAPTAIVFNTGTVGLGTLVLSNTTYGTEAARITSNRNLLIGAASDTGTASQKLQVTGGAYVSGDVGIGTTNPTSKLHVIGNVLVTGITTSTDFNSSSDINLKDNIERIQNPIDKLQQLDGVTFNWKETHRASVGVIAQQVEKVLPQLVSGDETKTVNYNGLIALLIECVKEQQIEINNLKEKLK